MIQTRKIFDYLPRLFETPSYKRRQKISGRKHKNIQRNDDSVQKGRKPDQAAATRNSVADPWFSSRRAIAPVQNYDRLAGSHFYFGGKEQTPALQLMKVETKSVYQSSNRVTTRPRYREKNRGTTRFHDDEGKRSKPN
jgi:hypothetical protein